MNATEMGRRSDSLYYDNVSRRELCDRIAHLESDLEDAKDKNAKLRELLADVLDALCADKAGMFHKLILASTEDDMRELGIEV